MFGAPGASLARRAYLRFAAQLAARSRLLESARADFAAAAKANFAKSVCEMSKFRIALRAPECNSSALKSRARAEWRAERPARTQMRRPLTWQKRLMVAPASRATNVRPANGRRRMQLEARRAARGKKQEGAPRLGASEMRAGAHRLIDHLRRLASAPSLFVCVRRLPARKAAEGARSGRRQTKAAGRAPAIVARKRKSRGALAGRGLF